MSISSNLCTSSSSSTKECAKPEPQQHGLSSICAHGSLFSPKRRRHHRRSKVQTFRMDLGLHGAMVGQKFSGFPYLNPPKKKQRPRSKPCPPGVCLSPKKSTQIQDQNVFLFEFRTTPPKNMVVSCGSNTHRPCPSHHHHNQCYGDPMAGLGSRPRHGRRPVLH